MLVQDLLRRYARFLYLNELGRAQLPFWLNFTVRASFYFVLGVYFAEGLALPGWLDVHGRAGNFLHVVLNVAQFNRSLFGALTGDLFLGLSLLFGFRHSLIHLL